MSFDTKRLLLVSLAFFGATALQGAAHAADFSNSATYNSGFGMQPDQENAPVDPNLRDSNGNLTVVNGQFTSSSFAQSGAEAMSAASASANFGVGTNGTGTAFGGATAIGNSLNVVTVGSFNTVVVNAQQTNNGNQNASVSVNGH